jgi:hypothetical protein
MHPGQWSGHIRDLTRRGISAWERGAIMDIPTLRGSGLPWLLAVTRCRQNAIPGHG